MFDALYIKLFSVSYSFLASPRLRSLLLLHHDMILPFFNFLYKYGSMDVSGDLVKQMDRLEINPLLTPGRPIV